MAVVRRTSGPWMHLGAAKRFADQCVLLEAAHQQAQFESEEAETLLHKSLAAVILAASALDAYANQLLHDKQEVKDKWKARDEARSAAKKRSREKPGPEILQKFAYALEQRGRLLDETSKEYQDVLALIDVRNSLVHFWPEWTDEKKEHEKIRSTLRALNIAPSRVATNPAIAHFPEDYMGAALARWACVTARAFLERMRDEAGDSVTTFPAV